MGWLRGFSSGILPFFLFWCALVGATEPSPSSLELWAFDPDWDLPPARGTKIRPDVAYWAGPAVVTLAGIRDSWSATGIKLVGGGLEIGHLRMHTDIRELRAKTFTAWYVPKVSFSEGIGLRKVVREHLLYSLDNVVLVVASHRPLRLALPEKILIRVNQAGKIEFADRAALVAFLGEQVDHFLSEERYEATFRHWLVNVGLFGDEVADVVYRNYRAEILALAREKLKAELEEGQHLQNILDKLNATMPFGATAEFDGIDLVLERFVLEAGAPRRALSGWRLRPADYRQVFSSKVWRSLAPQMGPWKNRLSLLVHGHALDALFAVYLDAIRRGVPGTPQLPPEFGAEPDRPLISYRCSAAEHAGLRDFFRQFMPDLRETEPRISVHTAGEHQPRLTPWYREEGGRTRHFLDLTLTFALWERGDGGSRPRTVRLGLTFEAGVERLLRLQWVRPTEGKVVAQSDNAFEAFTNAFGNRLKFLVLQSLVNQKLDVVSGQIRGLLSPHVKLHNIRMLGEWIPPGETRARAEALALDFEVTTPPPAIQSR